MTGLAPTIRRIAISLGGGYVPGLGTVVRAVATAARQRGWEVVGIRDGFDGLLFPERYPRGGLVEISALGDDGGSLLGTGTRTDPFRAQLTSKDGFVEEVDATDRLLAALKDQRVDAMVAIVGGSAVTGSHAVSVMWKLARKGLRCICIPKSAENDLAATAHPFGYDSILSYTAECLRHIRIAARDQGRIALVEVPGQYAGWLALEAGLAAAAEVILVPEIPYHAELISRHIDRHPEAGLIVVAEGARALAPTAPSDSGGQAQRARLSSLSDADYGGGAQVIHRAGRVARQTHEALQRHSAREIFPLLLDQLVRAGAVSASDRALGAAYAVAAVEALAAGQHKHLIAARADRFESVLLSDAVNRVRTLEPDAVALRSARALGICLGDAA